MKIKYLAVLISAVLLMAACGGDNKATIDEVSSSMNEHLKNVDTISFIGDENLEVFSKCVSDQIYERFSTSSLNSIANSESFEDFQEALSNLDEEENAEYSKATEECSREIDLTAIPTTAPQLTTPTT